MHRRSFLALVISSAVLVPAARAQTTDVVGTVSGWVNTDLLPTAAPVLIPLAGVEVRVDGGAVSYTDPSGAFRIPHPSAAPVTVHVRLAGRRVGAIASAQSASYAAAVAATPGVPVAVTVFGPSATGFELAQSTCYWGIHSVHEWVRSVLGDLPELDVLDAVTAMVNIGGVCGATHFENTLQFRVGSGCANAAYSTVIAHEWGHALDLAFGGTSRTQGLSEGSADIVAAFWSGQPIIGHDFSGPGQHASTVANNATYPPSGSTHQQGQVWSGFCWDVREGLRAALGAVAGTAQAERIVLAAMVANADDQPAAVRAVFEADDDDGNLANGTPNYAVLAAAAQKRNLPYPLLGGAMPGSFAGFGAGCAGTGTGDPLVQICHAPNPSGTLVGQFDDRQYAVAIDVPLPQFLLLTGVELQTAAGTGAPLVISVAVHQDAGGVPAPFPDRVGAARVGTTEGLYQARFEPLAAPGGQRLWVVFGDDRVLRPELTAGIAVPHRWRPLGSTTWTTGSAPWAVQASCYEFNQPGVPQLTTIGLPELGRTFDIELSFAQRRAPAVLMLGGSNTVFGPTALPFDLTGAGAPGCAVLVAPELTLSSPASSTGTARQAIAVPAVSSLAGLSFFAQWLVTDPGANPLGVALSNAGTAIIGWP